MKTIIIFALNIALIISFASCNARHTTSPQRAVERKTTDSLDNKAHHEWIYNTLYSIVLQDGRRRTFVDVYSHISDYREDYHALFAIDENPIWDLSRKHMDTTFIYTKYPRYEDIEDFFYYIGGIPNHILYLPSPDNKSLYIVTRVNANSNGWITEYQLFIVDCETLKARFIRDFAAIAVTANGFSIAVARLTNRETATCTAEEIWVMHDEYLDWNGNVVNVSKKEYDYKKMKRKYQSGEYTFVKGFHGTIE